MKNAKQIDLDFFQELLTSQLYYLLSHAERTVGVLVETGDSAADPLDRASMEYERNSILRICDRESRLIKKIKVALAKIEEGIYGICETCGDPIPVARLKARPVAAHCIGCKQRMEAYEKAVGW